MHTPSKPLTNVSFVRNKQNSKQDFVVLIRILYEFPGLISAVIQRVIPWWDLNEMSSLEVRVSVQNWSFLHRHKSETNLASLLHATASHFNLRLLFLKCTVDCSFYFILQTIFHLIFYFFFSCPWLLSEKAIQKVDWRAWERKGKRSCCTDW